VIGGPLVLPACCETAIDALSRSYDLHIANANTPWVHPRYRSEELLKAHRCLVGIETVNKLTNIYQLDTPLQ
jgi:hypothetical protein